MRTEIFLAKRRYSPSFWRFKIWDEGKVIYTSAVDYFYPGGAQDKADQVLAYLEGKRCQASS